MSLKNVFFNCHFLAYVIQYDVVSGLASDKFKLFGDKIVVAQLRMRADFAFVTVHVNGQTFGLS